MPQGTYVACAFKATSLFLGPFISMTGGKKVVSLVHEANREDLHFIKELIEDGKIIPVIDRRYPLSELAEAIRYFEEGQAQGKAIIAVAYNNK